MATFKFEGVDELIKKYESLYNDSEEMIGKAIYNGAAVVMKEVVNGIDSITTDNRFGTSENPANGPSDYQKAGLRQSVGIAPMRDDSGFRNVKIGFDGYNGLQTKAWPSGQPNSMVARAVESGTSWMRKQPFMRRAEQTARPKCEAVMQQTIDREINARMNGSGGSGNIGGGGSVGGSGGSGSVSLKSYKSAKKKTTTSKKSTGVLKTAKKGVSRYKQIQRKMSDPLNTKNTKRTLKKYGKKALTKNHSRKK